eukprot:1157811-Pelagomonas_calceolata.AAC.6
MRQRSPNLAVCKKERLPCKLEPHKNCHQYDLFSFTVIVPFKPGHQSPQLSACSGNVVLGTAPSYKQAKSCPSFACLPVELCPAVGGLASALLSPTTRTAQQFAPMKCCPIKVKTMILSTLPACLQCNDPPEPASAQRCTGAPGRPGAWSWPVATLNAVSMHSRT